MVVLIVAFGILSRIVRTGWPLTDKYLGDALYAAMIYALLRSGPQVSPGAATAAAAAIMIAIECFQLTSIPHRLLASDSIVAQAIARLLGTAFSLFDLLAYAFGIAAGFAWDKTGRRCGAKVQLEHPRPRIGGPGPRAMNEP